MEKKKVFNVVAAIIINDGKVLCGQRGKGYFESKWEFPGGKIENGESKQMALKREIKEELGYSIHECTFFMTVEVEYEDFIIHMDTYLSCCNRKDLISIVHQELRWLNISELLEYDWCLPDKIVVNKIINDGGIETLINNIGNERIQKYK